MPEFVDITGERFGRLVVLGIGERRIRPNGVRRIYWLCRCDCGTELLAYGSNLIQRPDPSCGCLQTEKLVRKNRTHGGSVRGARERLYEIWTGMLKRCRRHPDYAGRGITVCPEWSTYETFRDWALANGYADDLSIDRVNNDGSYTPSNCRWATYTEQANNRRPRKRRSQT